MQKRPGAPRVSDSALVAPPPPDVPRTDTMRAAVVANLAGRGWPIVLGFLAVPIYLGHLGIEAYALVSAFAVLQSICSVLDMGLGATLTRQLARLTGDPQTAPQARRLVRTLEVPYWAIAALLAIVSIAAAGPIAARWLRPEAVPLSTLRETAVLMGLGVAAQLPFSLYVGGLLGIQRQVLLNVIVIVAATFRVALTIYVLERVAPTIEAFFICQLVASALQTAAGLVALWWTLPKSPDRPRFDGRVLRENLRFAAGVAGITVAGLVLIHADKFVLTKLLPLREFGYYGIAASLALALAAISHPVYAAVFPRLSRLAAGDDRTTEAAEYHRASQLLAVLLLPLAATVAWHAHEILLAWTQNADVADNAHLVTTLLVCGSALHGLMTVPYSLMLAHGWTRLPLVVNVVAICVLIPLLVWSSRTYGSVGAAAIWCALNAGYIVISVPVMHTRLLRGEMTKWYLGDVGRPLAAALAAVVAAHFLIPVVDGRWPTVVRVGVITLFATLAAASAAPEVRRPWIARLRRRLG